jgi:ABC-2 type transport system permease protein
VNSQHLAAFVWLRYRLLVNQLRRGGMTNRIILGLVAASVAAAVAGGFVTSLSAGYFGLPVAPPVFRLLAWDGVALAYLFVRLFGVLAELQRTDGVAPGKYLHLPVSPAGAFVVNYASTLASPMLALFVAVVAGLTLGQVAAGHWLALLTPVPAAAFAFAVTAMADLASSWVTALAATPRRRQGIAAAVTMLVVLVVQMPSLLSMTGVFSAAQFSGRSVDRGALDPVIRLANTILPPGWFPLAAADLADGAVLPALLATLGYVALGLGALRLSYRSTRRQMRGPTGGGVTAAGPAVGPTTKPRLLEWRLPGVTEPAAAVALATVRNVTKDTQLKATLIAPVAMFVLFGMAALIPAARAESLPSQLPPLMALAAVAFMTSAASQLVANQFAFDRAGFRAAVLSPADRRDIVLGKNLASAPFALALAALALVAVGLATGLRFDHWMAAAVAAPALHLLYCLPGNLVSVLAPIGLPLPGGKPQPRMIPMLAQMSLLVVLPLMTLPFFVPLGVEFLLEWWAGREFVPVALPLTLVLAGAVALLYRAVLPLEGQLLHTRERAVLAEVVSKSE